MIAFEALCECAVCSLPHREAWYPLQAVPTVARESTTADRISTQR